MAGPLEGIRVIDLTSGPVGGLATMILSDFGADVIKVERPGGDPFRSHRGSPMWLRGKRSVTLDLARGEERERLQRLVRSADAVVTAFRPSTAARLGCDYETLSRDHPGLVHVAITGFGPQGPYADYPGYEGVVAAKAGRMMHFEGTAPRPGPQFAAVQVASHQATQAAVTAVLVGLFARERTGRGAALETSMLQGLTAYDMASLIRASLMNFNDEPWDESALLAAPMPSINYQPVMAGDGRWLQLGNLLQHLFDNFLACTDLLDIYAEDRYAGSTAAWADEDREAFRDRMLLRMQEKSADEWMEIFVAHGGVASTIFRHTNDALDDPDLTLNGHVMAIEDPRGEQTRAAFASSAEAAATAPGPRDDLPPMQQLGLVARLTATPGTVKPRVPAPGEHTDEVLGSLEDRAASSSVCSAPVEGRAGGNARPLDGLLVLDFATIIATPLGTSNLADLGARVIKVEPPGGDPWRGMGPGALGVLKTNAGKESICLDLKSPEGQEIIGRLIQQADVITHNFRPGVPERLGIGYERARELRPEIVYLSMNGYGPDGPSAHRPATHPIPGAAMGGALFQAGEGMPPVATSIPELREGARRLFRANEVNPDPNVSAIVTSAVMLGLTARQRTGAGQQIFIDMLGANAWANADDCFWYEGREPRPTVDADLRGTGPLYRLYECREGWVFLALLQEHEWERFCALTARDDLARDARFATRRTREEHGDALIEVLQSLFETDAADAWEARLAGAGLGCVRADGPVPGAFFLHDAQIRENAFTARVTHPQHGDYMRHGALVRVRGVEDRLGPAPMAGQHADAILAELGFTGTEIAALRERNIIWSEPGIPVASGTEQAT